MKKFITIMFTLAFCGCSNSSIDITDCYEMPPELKDYKIIALEREGGLQCLYVLVKKEKEDRPAIGVSTSGKHPVHTIVVDGVEYIKKQ